MTRFTVGVLIVLLCGANDPAEAEKPVRTSVAELVYTYRYNEARVDLLFQDQIIEVQGPLVQVSREDGTAEGYVVLLRVEDNVGLAPPHPFVRCSFPKSAQRELANLDVVTEHVLVRGRCVGHGGERDFRIGGMTRRSWSLDLVDCELLPVSKPESVPVRPNGPNTFPPIGSNILPNFVPVYRTPASSN